MMKIAAVCFVLAVLFGVATSEVVEVYFPVMDTTLGLSYMRGQHIPISRDVAVDETLWWGYFDIATLPSSASVAPVDEDDGWVEVDMMNTVVTVPGHTPILGSGIANATVVSCSGDAVYQTSLTVTVAPNFPNRRIRINVFTVVQGGAYNFYGLQFRLGEV